MINYSVFKGTRPLCNSYLKRKVLRKLLIRKVFNETFFEITHLQ